MTLKVITQAVAVAPVDALETRVNSELVEQSEQD